MSGEVLSGEEEEGVVGFRWVTLGVGMEVGVCWVWILWGVGRVDDRQGGLDRWGLEGFPILSSGRGVAWREIPQKQAGRRVGIGYEYE